METNNVNVPEMFKKMIEVLLAWRIIWRELVRDKIALYIINFSCINYSCLYMVYHLFLDQKEIVRVDLFAIYEPPSEEFWLGTDYGGRDVFGQLIIGTRNSFQLGF